MGDEDAITALLSQLESSPEPPRFCFHKALGVPEHQCTYCVPSSIPQTNTVLVASTPIQLRKVLSPCNLELDSDTSSLAAWSFSMATPTTLRQHGEVNKEAPSASNVSMVSSTTSPSVVDEEEGSNSSDDSAVRLRCKHREVDHGKTLMKIKDQVLIKNKTVARALFPAKGDADKASPTKSQRPPSTPSCASFDPCKLFSPIPSMVSPLVNNQHHAKLPYARETPLKGVGDPSCSVASLSMFETPAKRRCSDNKTTSSSQELFGSPEMFTPAQLCHQSEQPMEEQGSKINTSHDTQNLKSSFTQQFGSRFPPTHKEESCIQPSPNTDQLAVDFEQQIPLPMKEFCSEPHRPHLLIHSTPLSSVSQPGPVRTHSHGWSCDLPPRLSTQPRNTGVPSDFLHSTPLCLASQPTRKSSNRLPQVAGQETPEVPLTPANEPSPATHCERPIGHVCDGNAADQDTSCGGPSIRKKDEKIKNEPSQHNNYSFGSMGDVMDMLFMSSSQLDAHLSAYKASLDNPPSTKLKKTTGYVELDKGQLDCEQTEDVLLPVQHIVPEVQCMNERDGKQQVDNTEVDESSNKIEGGLSEMSTDVELEVTKLPPNKAKPFHYPSKLRHTLKRRKGKVRTKEYGVVQKSYHTVKASSSLPCMSDNSNSNVEECIEPLLKKPRVLSDDVHDNDVPTSDTDRMSITTIDVVQPTGDGVTKVEESMIEVSLVEKEDSPFFEEMDTERLENPVQSQSPVHQQHEVNVAQLSSGESGTTLDRAEDQPIIEEAPQTEGLGVLIPPKPIVRAPGLRRMNKKPIATTLEMENVNQEPAIIESPFIEPPDRIPLDSNSSSDKSIAPKIPSFVGFQTAAGSSISVSEQALKKAQQLIGSELEELKAMTLAEAEHPKSPPACSSAMATPTSSITSTDKVAAVKDLELNPTTSLSTFVSPAPSRAEGIPQSLAATFPRKPSRRTATKPFKAPRKSCDVSSVEEQASVSRILRSFWASGAVTDPPASKPAKSRIQNQQVINTGFQTAGGSKLTVSTEAMEKAKWLVTEDKENGIAADIGSSPLLRPGGAVGDIVTGFKTASGKGLVVPASTMARASIITEQDALTYHSKTPSSTCEFTDAISVGFQMASGKSLSVSAGSLSRAKSLLASDLGCSLTDGVHLENCDIDSHGSVRTGFQTAGGKDISVSSKSLNTAKKLVEEKEEETSSHPFDDIKTSLFQSPIAVHREGHSDRVVTGFSTAKGSSISVSKTSLQNCQELIETEKEAQKMTLEHLGDDTTDSIKSDNSPCSLTAEDVESFSAFTQIDFQRHMKSPERIDATARSVTVTLPPAEASDADRGCEGARDEKTETEEHGYLFSTQVVRQLTDFSSEEEMSCGEEDDVDPIPAPTPKDDETEASKSMDNKVCEEVDFCHSEMIKDANVTAESPVQLHVGEAGQPCDSSLNEEEDSGMLVAQQTVVDVTIPVHVDVDVESVPPHPLVQSDDDNQHQNADEATLSSTLCEGLTESMIESMEVSINVSDIQPKDTGESESEHTAVSKWNVVKSTASSSSNIRDDRSVSMQITPLENSVAERPPLPSNHSQPSSSTPSASRFPGLQTASGKQVNISESALKMAKQTLGSDTTPLSYSTAGDEDADLLLAASGQHSSETSPMAAVSDSQDQISRLHDSAEGEGSFEYLGVQTASGKQAGISKNALLATEEVLGSGQRHNHPSELSAESHDASKPHPIGLVTAGGHRVQISDEALAAVRSSAGRMNTGLKTASGSEVKISGESMRAAKLLLDGGAGTSSCGRSTGSGFPGLFTAGGREVAVSQKSIEAARAVLDDSVPTQAPNGRGGTFPGLMTAGGSKVIVSETAIQAARAVLGGGASPGNHGGTFPSLMTASGSKVTISQSSLRAVRAMLDGTRSCVSRKSPSPLASPVIGNAEVPSMPQPVAPPTCTTPLATQPSSLPGAPTRKYKPTFKSGGAKNGGRSQSFDYPGASDTSSTSAISVNVGLQHSSQRRPAAGLLTTPEGTLYDRSGRRPLLPKQSHADNDDSYATRNTPSVRPLVSQHSLPRPQPSSSQSHSKAPSLVFKTPLRTSSAVVAHSSTHTQRPSQPSHTRSQSAANCASRPLFTTPRRTSAALYGTTFHRKSQSTCRPVWKRAKCLPSATPSDTNTTSKRLHDHKGGLPDQSLTGESTSFTYSQPKIVSRSSVHASGRSEQSLSLSSYSGNTVEPCVRTSTQLSEEEGDKGCVAGKLDTPLSPLHITLSQICAMEDSQVMTGAEEEGGGGGDETTIHLTCEASIAKSSTATVEDSGYISREVSAVKSPSPLALEGVDQCLDLGSNQGESEKTAVVKVCRDSGAEDGLFEEFALEGLDDSLEEIGDNVSDVDAHCLAGHEKPVDQSSKLPARSPPASAAGSVPGGVVKPQIGSLLLARLNNARINLQDAVRDRSPGGFSPPQLRSLGVSDDTMLARASNAVDFSFSGAQYFSNAVLRGSPVCIGDGAMLRLSRNGRAGVTELWEAFRTFPSVDESLISYKWFVNHYRQLVWKLASMEVSYPHTFGGRCLTPDYLMLQLKYRYDREIDQAERSALHKICENDDVPSRRMVLCVSRVYKEASLPDASGKGVAPTGTDIESGNETVIQSHETTKDATPAINLPSIEVTDGWYSLPCVLDNPLKQILKSGRVKVGTKLLVYGAELIGQNSPSHPLEVPSSVALKLSTNSTRRARWFAKLGYQSVPRPFAIPLMSIFPEGGLVGCTDVVIARVYPLAYLEKREGKKSVLRSERLEQKIAALHEAERQRKIDSICSKVQKEFEDEVTKQDYVPSSCRRSRRLNTLQIKQLQDGEEIYNALSNAPDPQAFQEVLSPTQIILLESYRHSLVAQRQEELQSRIRDAVKEAEDQLPAQRNVIPLLRIRIVPTAAARGSRGDLSPASDCHLSVWRPTDELRQLLREGRSFRISNLTAYPSRYKHLQLTATRSSRYEPLRTDKASSFYHPRVAILVSQLGRCSTDQLLAYREFDTAGIVVCTCSDHVMSHDPDESDQRQVDSVYVADGDGCLMVVRMWDGLKSQGLEDVVKPGAVLAMSNLSYRGLGHAHNLPTANAGDSVLFSQKPKEQHLKVALADLNRKLPSKKDRFKFLQTLEDEISSYL